MTDFKKTIEKIKSRGYWEIKIVPQVIDESVFNRLSDAKEVVKNSAVELRGWDHPHIPTHSDNQDIYVAGDKIEAWIDWDNHKEAWRMYQSGLYVHILGLSEDWVDESKWYSENDPARNIKSGEVLSVIGTTYSITELFVYAKNLVEAGIYDSGLSIQIKLKNTANRKLHIFDFRRTPLFGDYKCRVDEVVLPELTCKKDDFLDSYLDKAFELTINLFNQFNWDNPPEAVIREDQKKLLERRI